MRKREFVPEKKLVCERYKNPSGIWCETYTHPNELSKARKRARGLNLMYPGCNAEAFIVSANPSRYEDKRGKR